MRRIDELLCKIRAKLTCQRDGDDGMKEEPEWQKLVGPHECFGGFFALPIDRQRGEEEMPSRSTEETERAELLFITMSQVFVV